MIRLGDESHADQDPASIQLASRHECAIAALKSSLAMRDQESSALRLELEESRQWSDRGWARVKELERRLEAIATAVRGK